jgi:hypothetical protein
VDVFGLLRGRYISPAFAIKVGETAIRNCFRDQLSAIRKEGLDYMGNHPCVFTEIGIPYDMDDKYAYKTGDFSSQSGAMDANHFALEGCGANGFTLWVYMALVSIPLPPSSSSLATYTRQNNHEWGDLWNGEDLSIFSIDDTPLPVASNAYALASNLSLPARPFPDQTSPSYSSARASESLSPINPTTLKRTLSTPSISTVRSATPAELANTPGMRAAEAYVRPSPIATNGSLASHGFDLRTATFTVTLSCDAAAGEDSPTEMFLPEYHFPAAASEVEVSSGKWAISVDDVDGGLIQVLRWWHGAGEQKVTVRGVRHKLGGVADEEPGYLDQCQQSRCVAM